MSLRCEVCGQDIQNKSALRLHKLIKHNSNLSQTNMNKHKDIQTYTNLAKDDYYCFHCNLPVRYKQKMCRCGMILIWD